MSELYPLVLEPDFRERVWGTRELGPIYSREVNGEPIGEAWLTGEDCRIANGSLAGTTLAEVTRRFGRELVGEAAPQVDRFPLLIKFLFPCQKLSVQVHPDDETAKRAGLPCGKTECWYVLAAEPGAQVGLGLKPGVTREEFARAIREVRAEELMNWIDIHPGELIYVAAGTVHAIGPGSILVETQQNSDTTYRLYDYGRPRELHVQKGLQALKETTRAGKVAARGSILVESPCFVVEKQRLRDQAEFALAKQSSAQVLVAIEGGAAVECGRDKLTFARGQAVVIPAALENVRVRPQWDVEFLRMSLPAGAVAHPETTMATMANAGVE